MDIARQISLERRVHVSALRGDDVRHAGSATMPLKTIAAGLRAVRRWRAKQEDLTVQVSICFSSEEIYYLPVDSPIILTIEDSYTTLESCSESTAWLSGGLALDGWTYNAAASLPGRPAYSVDLPDDLDSVFDDTVPKVLRFSASTTPQLRYPDRSADPVDFTSGYLFVNESIYLDSNEYTTFYLTVRNEDSLPAFFKSDSPWSGAFISLLPDAIWLNYLAPVELASESEKAFLNVSATVVLRVTCPSSKYHACHGSSTKVTTGNPFWVFGGPSLTPAVIDSSSSSNPWIYDDVSRTFLVWPLDGTAPADGEVVLPTTEALVRVEGRLGWDSFPHSSGSMVQGVKVKRLGFLDTQFSDSGFQDTFNVYTESEGIPSSAALRISGAEDIEVEACHFESLAGAGVSIAYGSRLVRVENCTLSNLGQSGILIFGNSTTQPTECEIVGNTISRVGQLLFSAAGIYVSTGSDLRIVGNDVSYSTRWGIAVRSEEYSESASYRNLIELNRIHHTGLATSDLGAISLISWLGGPNVNTTIRNNLVSDVVGMGGNEEGEILSPFNARGLYLDNEASGFLVEGNVFRDIVTTAVFIHGGGNNTVQNNIMFNVSMLDDQAGDGQWSYSHYWSSWANRSVHNVVERNVIAYFNITGKMQAVGCPSWGRCSDPGTFDSVDRNLYYQFGSDISDWSNLKDLTPMGDWKEWQGAGYDAHSRYADPLFEDAGEGFLSLCLRSGSPAHALGFLDLPRAICDAASSSWPIVTAAADVGF